MNLNELRDILYDFQDTPANRNELCEELVATNASDMVWGYAEQYIPGLEEWWNRQLKIQENLALHNSSRNDYVFDMKNLAGAYLHDANLTGADLSNADLRNAHLRLAYFAGRANLRGADLSNADLKKAYLGKADLSGADLSNANLEYANLFGADLRGAVLVGIRWYKSNWSFAVYDDETVFADGTWGLREEMLYKRNAFLER